MTVELVATERRLWSGTATAVFTRTTEGEIGVLPRHIPLLGELVGDCFVRIELPGGDSVRAAVQGGFLSVTGDRVSILAESAQRSDEIDVEQAELDLHHGDDMVRARALSQLRALGRAV